MNRIDKVLMVVNGLLVIVLALLFGLERYFIRTSPLRPDGENFVGLKTEELFCRTPIVPDTVRLCSDAPGVELVYEPNDDGIDAYPERHIFVRGGRVVRVGDAH